MVLHSSGARTVFALALICLTIPATAADFFAEADAPAQNWDGFYAGIVAGGGLLSETTTEHGMSIYGGGASESEFGGLAGGTIGFNVQSGAAVYGLEADLQATWLGTDQTFADTVTVNRSSWDWLATVRARGGIAVDSVLAYATAGVAVVSTDYFYGRSDLIAGMYAESSGVQYGLTAGVGVEYALGDNMSVKAEYLYLGLPSQTASTDFGEIVDFVSSANIARVGLNFHF